MSAPTRSSFTARLFATRPPLAALQIDARRVVAVGAAEQGGKLAVAGYASQLLPAGAVTPALNAVNVHDAAALSGAIRIALDQLSPRPRKVALVLPDAVGKVTLVRFDKVPPRAADLEQLIRWQVRKAAPFRIEDAQVAWAPGAAPPAGGREFLVTAARRDVVESYESACDAAGAHAGLVDLASLNIVNAVMAQGAPAGGDWLLVHVTADDGTLAVVRGGDVIFFRHRAISGVEDLAELVHQTAMYHEDRLGGGGFSRVTLAGASARGAEEAERMRRLLQERVGAPVEALDVRQAVTLRDRITASPELLDALGAPVGLLLRERAVR